jgi:hypothetical protein
MIFRATGPLLLLLATAAPAAAQVEHVWLTHRTADASKLVVNWTTRAPGDSAVRFGPKGDRRKVRVPGSRMLHHVEIPLPKPGEPLHYSVSSGDQASPDYTFKGYPTDRLRVAVVANWQSKPDLKSLIEDDPHLLLTAGDNIPDLWHDCKPGSTDCWKPYTALIDRYPELFRSVAFLPALGNHDREIRRRGPKPPPEPVYDIEAEAFRAFFPLPGDEWKWHLDIPGFDVRFVALDLNHISDRGTTWQTCHDFGTDSVQYHWYRGLMDSRPPGFVVTLYNERNSTMRGQAKGAWDRLFRKGTIAVSGFGYFAERAEADGFHFWNTSLGGKGDRYPDPHSKFLAGEHNYLLITVEKKQMTVELKSLDGRVLDRQEYRPQPGVKPPAISGAKPDDSGFQVHDVTSPYQPGTTQIRVLAPERLEKDKHYPVVYVLPVEAGTASRYGDGLKEIKKLGLHNTLGAVFVAPTFSQLPWYADHPTDAAIRQESYFLNAVVPFIERTYPVRTDRGGRLLLGFSKSGWGAYSLLLRHPNLFGKAAAWDAPLMMDRPGKYGSGPIFGTDENFAGYRIATLLERNAALLRDDKRLLLFGYGNFRDEHRKAHELMDRLRIAHEYRDGPARLHDWHSGWVKDAAEWLLAKP